MSEPSFESVKLLHRGTWSGTPTVLLIDDDPGTREALDIGLRHFGFRVMTAGTGREAVELATQHHIDCFLVDQRLPDMLGTDCVRAIRGCGVNAPFAVMSGYLAVPIVVEAMRLGAHEVLEKPVDIEDLATVLSNLVGIKTARSTPAAGATSRPLADRWADHAEKALECATDPRTLECWARAAGVSYSGLCETCRLLSMQPHSARDFVRVLRILLHAPRLQCPPEALLDVSDRRTLATLLRHAGVEHRSQFGSYSVRMFLERQTFVERHNHAVRRLSARLDAHLAPGAGQRAASQLGLPRHGSAT